MLKLRRSEIFIAEQLICDQPRRRCIEPVEMGVIDLKKYAIPTGFGMAMNLIL
ncbi:MAG: hypothetical protein UZ14_CFX002002687 [Chloroflexi bacterium OLB14]|nr:MAG: hypothetical protein UZ14_CFX002002687 [Chloroflexi bacterium OLB14]